VAHDYEAEVIAATTTTAAHHVLMSLLLIVRQVRAGAWKRGQGGNGCDERARCAVLRRPRADYGTTVQPLTRPRPPHISPQGWLAAAGQACGFILTLNPFEVTRRGHGASGRSMAALRREAALPC
jgi:hypothetical protein